MVWRGSQLKASAKMTKIIQNGNNNNYLKAHKDTSCQRDYSKHRNLMVYVLPGFCAVLLYTNSLSGDYVHDDIMAIRNNPDVLQRTNLSQVFKNDFWGQPMSDNTSHKSYRPLCTLTFRFNHMLFGLNPLAFHVTNILLHMLATVLFTYVCKNVINFSKLSALLAGLLFAVHPIHTEAVSGIVGRADVLACVLFLLSLIAYVKSIGHVWPGCATSTRKPCLLLLSMLLAACAMLVKEHGLTVLGVCVVYDCFLQYQVGTQRVHQNNHIHTNGFHHVKKSDRLLHPFYKRLVVIFVSLSLLILFRIWMLNGQLPRFSSPDNPASFAPQLLTRLLTYLYLLVFNAWLLLCPSVLSYDWQFTSIPLVENITDVRNLATLLFIVSMVLYTFHCLVVAKDASQKIQLFGLSLLVIPFLPASNIFFRVGFVVAERILYIPSMGYCILVVHGFDTLTYKFRRKRLSESAFLFMLLLLAIRTVIRNQVWQSREQLFRSGLGTLPHNPKMHYNFANFLKDTDQVEEAIKHYRTTLRLHPDHASAHNNLGTLLNDTEEAEMHYRKAIRINPAHSNAHYNLGTLLHQKGLVNESIHMLQTAIQMNPEDTQAQLYLASVLGEHDDAEAEKVYRAVVRNKPDDPDGYNNLGAYLHKKDRFDEAAEMYKKALDLDPEHVVVIVNLARLAKSLNRLEEAEAYYLRASIIKRDATTLDNLAVFYFNIGKPDLALVLFQEALQKDPESLDVKMHYASTLAGLYESATAEKLLKEVLERQPENLEALKNLATVYGLTKRHQQALVILEKAIMIALNTRADKATLVGLYQDKGNHLKDSQNFKEAIKTYELLAKLDSGSFQTHLNLGVLYHMGDNLEKAQHHYLAAYKIHPNDKLLLLNMEKLKKREVQMKQQAKGNSSER